MSQIKVVGLDVGYADTKAAHRNQQGEIVLTSFPSLYVTQTGAAEQFTRGGKEFRQVKLGEKWFFVGKGVDLLSASTSVTTQDYSATDPYLALALGMAADICARENCKRIANLVVGLPVDVAKNAERRMALIRALDGKHAIGARGQDSAWELDILAVEVIPQPHGALSKFIAEIPEAQSMPPATLVIDIGNGTSDWLFCIDNESVLNQSGSINEALMSLKRELAQDLVNQGMFGMSLDIVDRILRSGSHHIGHRRVTLAEIQPSLQAHIKTLARKVVKAIGEHHATDIVVTGGAASQLAPEFAELYPNCKVHLLSEDPAFNNAEGFLLYGEYFA
jgi:PRTRC genetic system protein D